jgi:hypothetical protein
LCLDLPHFGYTLTSVIRQSQNYFAAAVSAALVNAAAITAFVLFTILSSVHGFGLRSVLDAVDSIGSPSQSSAAPDPAGGTLSDPLIRDVGAGSARLLPNAGSSSASKPSSGLADSKRGINQSAASAKGGSAPGPSGSGGGISSPGGSGDPIAGGPTPSTGPTGQLNVPNALNNAVGSATSNVQSAGAGLTNTVTGTANGLLGGNSISGGNGGRSASASAPGTGGVNGAVNGATGAVQNTGLKLPGLG